MNFYMNELMVFCVVTTFVLLGLPHLDRHHSFLRKIVICFVLFLGARYLNWRFFVTVLPVPMPTTVGFWIWICFIVELMMLVESVVFFVIMFRDVNRKKQADRYEKALRSMNPEDLPVVDIFLPTYNESLEVLERSIIGALHLDWPKHKLKVWVLDDGKRDWLRDYCAEKGAGYIRRQFNLHAKAGNLNHATDITDGEYIAVFDADFVPHRQFLFRTMGFFSDPKVGIVQTPQFFFNKDYLQANLHLQSSVPDEQRIFFDVMMPARDAWNAAFWCGSCSVTRRKAIVGMGGVPTHSITEDLLTTLVMLRHGYVTRYLGEKLSHGLAPESLAGLIIQRERWCRGTIQAMYSKDGPLGPGLTFVQRLLFLPIHWVFSPIARLMSFIIPIVFLWTGVPALLIAHFMYTFDYHSPFVTLNFFVLLWLAPRHHIPFLSTAMLSLNSIQIFPAMLHSLIKPFAKGFGVTPKGNKHKKRGVHWYSFSISAVLFLLTLGGLFINMTRDYNVVYDMGFFPVAAFWATMNLVLAGIMMLLSFDHPRWRSEERFFVRKNFPIYAQGKDLATYVEEMSMGGFEGQIPDDVSLQEGDRVSLILHDVGPIAGSIIRKKKKWMHVKFDELTGKQRDDMIRHVYTGAYHNDTHLRSYLQIIRDLTKRAFGYHDHIYKKLDKK